MLCTHAYLAWYRAHLRLVFQGPVATSEKNRQLNRTTTDLDRTTTDLDRTTVASPRGCPIGPVAVAVAQADTKDQLQPVATSLFGNWSRQYKNIYYTMYCTNFTTRGGVVMSMLVGLCAW